MSAPATYEQALVALAAERDDLVVMTAENRAHVRGLPEALGPRFIDVGICEQTMVGAAAGLALRGRTPVVHALATFLTLRAFEFIRTDVGIPGLPVKLVGFVPGLLSEANGPTHQAIDDVAVMRAIPGMQVFCPADLGELVEALPQIVASRRPAYVRYTAAAAGGRARRALRDRQGGGARRTRRASRSSPTARCCARPSARAGPSPRAGSRSASSTCAPSSRWTRRRSSTRSGPPSSWSRSRTTSTAAGFTRSWPRPA